MLAYQIFDIVRDVRLVSAGSLLQIHQLAQKCRLTLRERRVVCDDARKLLERDGEGLDVVGLPDLVHLHDRILDKQYQSQKDQVYRDHDFQPFAVGKQYERDRCGDGIPPVAPQQAQQAP